MKYINKIYNIKVYVYLYVYITQASDPFLENREVKFINFFPKSPQIFSIQRKSITSIYYSSSIFKNRHNMLNLESSLYLKK